MAELEKLTFSLYREAQGILESLPAIAENDQITERWQMVTLDKKCALQKLQHDLEAFAFVWDKSL